MARTRTIKPEFFRHDWQEADRQIAHLANIKNQAVRDRQIVLICEALKRAMRGGMA